MILVHNWLVEIDSSIHVSSGWTLQLPLVEPGVDVDWDSPLSNGLLHSPHRSTDSDISGISN